MSLSVVTLAFAAALFTTHARTTDLAPGAACIRFDEGALMTLREDQHPAGEDEKAPKSRDRTMCIQGAASDDPACFSSDPSRAPLHQRPKLRIDPQAASIAVALDRTWIDTSSPNVRAAVASIRQGHEREIDRPPRFIAS